MASDRSKAKYCSRCGKPAAEVGPLSYRGICENCREQGTVKNAMGISEHRGPEFARWRRASVAAFGGILIDDLPEEIRAQIQQP